MTSQVVWDDPLNCLCANTRRAARHITQAYDDALRPVGLRATQFFLLTALSRAAGSEGIPVGELADILGMDRTTLTRNLAIAERQQWIDTGAAKDRRSKLIRLAPKGKTLLGKALPYWKGAQRRLQDRLGQQKAALLLSLAQSIGS
jgi:DNA-binding MarR family transcriptional regulator